MFKLEFKTDNAAFDDGGAESEAISILHRVTRELAEGNIAGVCRDTNRNIVGAWALKGRK